MFVINKTDPLIETINHTMMHHFTFTGLNPVCVACCMARPISYRPLSDPQGDVRNIAHKNAIVEEI